MPNNTESTINDALASVLRTKNPAWRKKITSERTGVIQGKAGLRPDILLPGSAPIVIESEFMPAREVEKDAKSRLGKSLKTNQVIEQVVALRLPIGLKTASQADLQASVAEATYEYCLLSLGKDKDADHVRWPSAGWISGDINALADLLENAGLSERLVAMSLEALESGVGAAAEILMENTEDKPDIRAKISEHLHQADSLQTMRMGMAIVANALTFQTLIAGAHDVCTIDGLRLASGKVSKQKTTKAWTYILENINYWPIFHIAREILEHIPAGLASFTRPVYQSGGIRTGVAIPSFAGFKTSEIERKHMSDQLKLIRKGIYKPASHGNAGLASNFIDLADAKLKPNGTLALILPMVFVQGKSWENARALFARRYRDIKIISIAAAKAKDRAFSADTAMGEIMLVARKRRIGSGIKDPEVSWIVLKGRPNQQIASSQIAKYTNILSVNSGSRIQVGGDLVGTCLKSSLSHGGCSGVEDPAVANAMLSLSAGDILLPRGKKILLKICPLGSLGEPGMLDRDIGHHRDEDSTGRAPFLIKSIEGYPTYPCLWAHDFTLERKFILAPDSQGIVRVGMQDKADKVWKLSSRLHFTRDFGLAAIGLSACLTESPTIGGRAWPNFKMNSEKNEETIVLWSNTILGLMLFWWAGSTQQPGRAILTITALPSLPVLDTRTLTQAQIQKSKQIFQDFRDREFLPANEAYRDKTRIDLDRAVLIDLLGLPEDILEPLDLLRRKWCAEPSVHGGKKTKIS